MARADCQSQGGDLASVYDATENALAVTAAGGTAVWIGLTDQLVEGTFLWADGSSSTYTNWAANEPNDTNGEDCVELKSNGQWNDLPCSYTRGYLCRLRG